MNFTSNIDFTHLDTSIISDYTTYNTPTPITINNLNNLNNLNNRYYSNIYNSYDYNSKINDRVINIEELMTLDKEKRKLIFDIYDKFINETNNDIKDLYLRTLESYNFFINKLNLERKYKINKVFKDDDKRD